MDTARLPGSSDTRVLLAGLVAFVGLVAYVAVAYVHTHALTPTTQSIARKLARELEPWTPDGSNLVPVPQKGGGFAVRVSPMTRGSYGVRVPTLVYLPRPGRRFVISLWLKGSRTGQAGGRGSRQGRIGVSLSEPGVGGASQLAEVDTSVPAETRWRKFTFNGRVEGHRLGLALNVWRNIYRRADIPRTWFEVRGLTVKLSP